MSYRDDGFAALERADLLQHELDVSTDRLAHTEAQLAELRSQLSSSYAKARFTSGRAEATEAELAELRSRLATLEQPTSGDFDSGLSAFGGVMIILLLLIAVLVGMLDACNAVPRNH